MIRAENLIKKSNHKRVKYMTKAWKNRTFLK